MQLSDPKDRALLAVLEALAEVGYSFVTPTPETHAVVVERPTRRQARNLRDVFGWSLPFEPSLLVPPLLRLLEDGGIVENVEGGLRSRVRVSTLHGLLLLHSAYPTERDDAVFLGPDSYRFADFLARELDGTAAVGSLVDIGAGAGVGALSVAACRPVQRIILTDVNPEALRLAPINAAHAGVAVETLEANGLGGLDGPFDLVIANPPFMSDAAGRAYRDGGGGLGAGLSLEWARQAVARLAPRGRLLLYTGSAIVDGEDRLRAALERIAAEAGCGLRYAEIDPDIFGSELARPEYAEVERIAAVGAVLEAPQRRSR